MAKNNDNLLTMIDENGKEVTCEILNCNCILIIYTFEKPIFRHHFQDK